MRYLPDRHYSRIEFWKERKCLRVLDGQDVRTEIEKGLVKATALHPPIRWPNWAKMSLDGSLNGHWPWTQPKIKEFLLQEARKFA